MWVNHLGRFAHGAELLLLHGIPVTLQAADEMGIEQEIRVASVPHRVQRRLAGNSMHGACIGFMSCIAQACVTTCR